MLPIWAGGTVLGQNPEINIDVQVPLLLKATTYDRGFFDKVGERDAIFVGICYEPGYRRSVNEKEALEAAFKDEGSHVPTKLFFIPLDPEEGSERPPIWEELAIVYITSLKEHEVDEVIEHTRKHDVMSVATVPEYVEDGVTMSFGKVGNRPKFMINQGGAKAEGCDFSSQILKLAIIF